MEYSELPRIYIAFMKAHPEDNNENQEAVFEALAAFAHAFPCDKSDIKEKAQ
jgi:hypothetical protein